MSFETAYRTANRLIRYDYRFEIPLPDCLQSLRGNIIKKLMQYENDLTFFRNRRYWPWFQRAGIETIIQVENNPFCIVILKKHWPTCKRYIDIYDTNLSLFREDFHARTPVKVTHTAKASMDIEPVEDGNRCTELYAKLDPNTSLWRTFQTSLDEDGGKSLVIFPRQGITYGGGLYLLKTLVSRLRVNAFTPLLLRPLASDGKRYNCSIKTLSKRYKGGKSNITTPEILLVLEWNLPHVFTKRLWGSRWGTQSYRPG